MDRFLASRCLSQANGWPLQLLSVACLSLAAKMEEPLVPTVLDLQVEGAKFIFEPRTICRMELLVLTTLNWRLRSITPFTFIDFFAAKVNSACAVYLISRATQIILTTISEINFLEFLPSAVSVASILHAANEIPNLSHITPESAVTWCQGLKKEVVSSIDYNVALTKSILYYEGQRSGKLPATQRLDWRADSGIKDGSDSGIDLVGGYYDAGDKVKFNFPMAYTITMLGWSVVEFQNQLAAKNELKNALAAVRWGTDYIVKAHPLLDVLYGKIGDGDSDHDCWERPEDMTTPRTSYKIDDGHTGSDLAGESAAALAAASIAFAKSDAQYSSQLITHAKQLFDFARNHPGVYSNSISAAAKFYASSGYEGDAEFLRYHGMQEFDVAMQHLEEKYGVTKKDLKAMYG